MGIPAADIRKLVKIVRQYEVIYGGGISSGDAAVREECEDLVASLESELGQSPKSARRGTSNLPSLVEARKRPRADEAGRPRSGRAAAMAELGGPVRKAAKTGAVDETAPSPAARPAKKAGAVARGAASRGKTEARGPSTRARPEGAKPEERREARPSTKGDAVRAPGRESKAPSKKAPSKEATARAEARGEPKRLFAALHLFDAFSQNRLPKYGGYIVCVRFSDDTGYTIIEIIGYENLQDIYPEGDTLVFKSVGCKLYAIIEPTSYLLKSVEPVNRPSDQMVPYRFAELMRITTKRFQSILIGLKPVFMPTSFSVFKPAGDDLAVLFYDMAEVYANIQDFTIMILRDRLGVPVPDSRKAAESIARGVREFRLWLDES